MSSRCSCMKYVLVDSLTCPGSRLTKPDQGPCLLSKVREKQRLAAGNVMTFT